MENVAALIGWMNTLDQVKEVNGMKFDGYMSEVVTVRHSGKEDTAIVLIKKQQGGNLKKDAAVMITGSVQTQKNYKTGKVLVYVLAETIENIRGKYWESENDVRITGEVGRGIKYRETPAGKHICDMFLRVPGKIKDIECFIPCICWGIKAVEAADYKKGEQIRIHGRLQSRDYIKRYEDGTEELKTCFEVSANEVERV